MPCVLFTFHAFGSWMPDREQGYVHRTEGLKPRDDEMAERYRVNQREPGVTFTRAQQQTIAASLRDAGPRIGITLHCIATDPSHVHVLTSWRHDRKWESIRRSLRTALSRNLNEAFGKRTWLVKNSSRNQVTDDTHFGHLVKHYLPSHRGIFFLNETDRARFRVEHANRGDFDF